MPMSSVQPEAVRWLWQNRIPRGKLTLINGDPGVAKSWLSLAIVTAYVNGAAFPGETVPHPPGRALLLTAEDGLADTVRPRLDGLGADVSRVEVFRGMCSGDDERPPSLVMDLWALKEMVAGGLYGLLIVDPLNAYLPGDLDSYRDVAVRSVLAPLAQLAERHDLAIVAIRHLTKGSRDRAIYRGQGSIAYTAAARVEHLVGFDPADESKHRRVMATTKINVAEQPPGVAFEIREGRFLWLGECDVSPETLLAPDPVAGEREQRNDAVESLRAVLADGPMPAEAALKILHVDFTAKQVRRARERLGVRPRREGFGPKSHFVWTLPASPSVMTPAAIDAIDAIGAHGGPPKNRASKASMGASMKPSTTESNGHREQTDLSDDASFRSLTAAGAPVAEPEE